MKKRIHYFEELNRNVITFSDHIEMFDNLILCFKKEQLKDPNRMFFWSSARLLKTTDSIISFRIAGKENVLDKDCLVLFPIILESPTVEYSVDEFYFEQ